jgi:hypothetical protein
MCWLRWLSAHWCRLVQALARRRLPFEPSKSASKILALCSRPVLSAVWRALGALEPFNAAQKL